MEIGSKEFEDMLKLIDINSTHGWTWTLQILSEHAATTGQDKLSKKLYNIIKGDRANEITKT